MNATGFPSPAQEYEKDSIDFNRLLIHHNASTFCMRYNGRARPDLAIRRDDILVVDSSLTPQAGNIAVIADTSSFVLAVLEPSMRSEYPFMYRTHPDSSILHPVEELFGVVTGIVRSRAGGLHADHAH